MNFTSFIDIPVIDAHIHYGHMAFIPSLMSALNSIRIRLLNIVCTPHQQRLSLLPDALYLKAHYPDQVYVFGNQDISALFIAPENSGALLAGYVDTLLRVGCDGIKMIEGKPAIRKMLPLPPFDSPVYAPYWERVEAGSVPVIFHVNDPPEFWDAGKVPGWARDKNWFYGDGSYVHYEQQYTEVESVLTRHPQLKIIFAHFYFLSGDLPRLAGYLERFPNMHVDLTPGIEMYSNFSRNLKQVRDFFLRYQDRIVYGTDIGAKALGSRPKEGIESYESQQRCFLVRSFLESDSEFRLPPGGYLFGRPDIPFHGIALPVEVLEKIYYRNFERLVGGKPRPLNAAAIIDECARLETMLAMLGSVQPGVSGDASIAREVQAYFRKLL